MVESLDESSETNQSTETAEVDPNEFKEDDSSGPSKEDNSNGPVKEDKQVAEENKSPEVESETTDGKADDKLDSVEASKIQEKKEANKETISNGPECPTNEIENMEAENDKEPTQESGTSAIMNGEAGPSSVPDIPQPGIRTRIDGPLFPVPSMTSMVCRLKLSKLNSKYDLNWFGH